MIISEHPQRSDEWHIDRLAIPTASNFDKIITTKGKPSDQAEKYMDELAGEYLTGRPVKRFVTQKMHEAAEREDDARMIYMEHTGNLVYTVGFCWKDEQKMFGASPDGLVDPDGGLELKDAEPHIQVMRRRTNWNGMEHFQQVQGNIYVCEREWWDLASYCEGMKPIIIRFERDNEFIKMLENELMNFCYKLAILIKKIKEV